MNGKANKIWRRTYSNEKNVRCDEAERERSLNWNEKATFTFAQLRYYFSISILFKLRFRFLYRFKWKHFRRWLFIDFSSFFFLFSLFFLLLHPTWSCLLFDKTMLSLGNGYDDDDGDDGGSGDHVAFTVSDSQSESHLLLSERTHSNTYTVHRDLADIQFMRLSF